MRLSSRTWPLPARACLMVRLIASTGGRGPVVRLAVGKQATSARKARTLLQEMVAKGTPVSERVFGEGGYLRPNFIQPHRCQNILIEGVTLRNSPMWQLHPLLC